MVVCVTGFLGQQSIFSTCQQHICTYLCIILFRITLVHIYLTRMQLVHIACCKLSLVVVHYRIKLPSPLPRLYTTNLLYTLVVQYIVYYKINIHSGHWIFILNEQSFCGLHLHICTYAYILHMYAYCIYYIIFNLWRVDILTSF